MLLRHNQPRPSFLCALFEIYCPSFPSGQPTDLAAIPGNVWWGIELYPNGGGCQDSRPDHKNQRKSQKIPKRHKKEKVRKKSRKAFQPSPKRATDPSKGAATTLENGSKSVNPPSPSPNLDIPFAFTKAGRLIALTLDSKLLSTRTNLT